MAIALALVYLGMERWLSRGAVAALILIPASWIVLVFANPEATMITEPRLVSQGEIYALEHSFPPLFLAYQAWGLGALLFSGLLLVGRGLIGAAMRKLLHICYGVLKSGRAFDASLHPTS